MTFGTGCFQEDASTVVKYQSYGPKHARLFQTNGVDLEKAIDPRREMSWKWMPEVI